MISLLIKNKNIILIKFHIKILAFSLTKKTLNPKTLKKPIVMDLHAILLSIKKVLYY